MDYKAIIRALLLFLSFVHAIAFKSSNISCPDAEREALLRFAGGFNRTAAGFSSWEGKNCCKWEGVECDDRTGHVVHLDLQGRALAGSKFDPSLLRLKHLSYLDLSSNYFGDIPIPPWIGSFEKLNYLNLSQSEFSGTVPHQLGNLSRLQILDLSVMDINVYRSVFSSAHVANIMAILDDDDESWEQILVLLLEEENLSFTNTVPRQRCRTRPFTGHQMLCDILNGHPERCHNHFRMSATTFTALRDELVGRGLISSTRNMTADEQLAIFLFCIGHGVANRILAETFQHSGETISRHFNNVLRGIVMLKDEYIMLPSSNAGVHPKIRDNPNFHPFKNAIGAVDGTHIPVVVRRSKQARFRCRKGFTSQNMMAAVSFDHNFLFVCTGWEGSAADMRVLRWACESGCFIVPEGKYYLVDSGYANIDKFLAPYRGERYHISQFDANARARVHRNPRDLYNHRHAQLRNVVEKTFGILKKRFKILTVAVPFPYKVQCLIAMACCVIHNFIRRHQTDDNIFVDELEAQDAEVEDEDTTIFEGSDDSRCGDDIRANITNQLWNNRT